jgi:hypothetical protein
VKLATSRHQQTTDPSLPAPEYQQAPQTKKDIHREAETLAAKQIIIHLHNNRKAIKI